MVDRWAKPYESWWIQMFGARKILLWSAAAAVLSLSPVTAAPIELACAVKRETADSTATSRVIAITFDGEKSTLLLSGAAQTVEFANVTSSNVSISGNTNDMSIGIDRSSWSIVLQTYSEDQVSNEFGTCRLSASPNR